MRGGSSPKEWAPVMSGYPLAGTTSSVCHGPCIPCSPPPSKAHPGCLVVPCRNDSRVLNSASVMAVGLYISYGV